MTTEIQQSKCVAEHFNLDVHPNIPAKSRKFFCGVEYEIESIKKMGDKISGRFMVMEDHSLRNGGREFKTHPESFENACESFRILHNGLLLGPDPFSDRTSTHVHVNVSSLTLVEMRQLVLSYALLEPLFFAFVGEQRKNSIFCVPLNYTYLPSLYKMPVDKMVDKWHKYTAFNIRPIKAQPDMPGLGTVEFRHLYGTNKEPVFFSWLTAIKQLYTFIESKPGFDIIKEIESGATAAGLAWYIVPELAKGHTPEQINTLCEDTLLDVKLAVGGLK